MLYLMTKILDLDLEKVNSEYLSRDEPYKYHDSYTLIFDRTRAIRKDFT